MVGAALAALMVMRPRMALWSGLALPAVQAFYSPPLLRLVVLGALFVGVVLGWKQASKFHRELICYLWLGVSFTLLIGWLLAVDPSGAEGVVVNMLYATMVASIAVIYRMTGPEWRIYVMAWGTLVSVWLTAHQVVVSGRTGALYVGENANALGMFAALGLVGSIGLIVGGRNRTVHILTAVPIGALCASGMVSSASRGALLVAAAGVVVQFAAPALRHSRMRALGAVALLGVGTYWIAMPVLTWFLAKAGRKIDATTNFDAREQILRRSFQMGIDHPLWGVGFGNLQVNDLGTSGSVSSHNAYVGLFAAAGILPIIFLGILVFTALSKARVSSEHDLLPLLVAALVIGFTLDWIPTAKLGPLVLGLIVCAAALSESSADGDAVGGMHANREDGRRAPGLGPRQ